MFSTHMNSSSDSWLQEVQKLTTVPELELFLLEHGEEVIDMLGQQVDRIEKNIKVMWLVTIHALVYEPAHALPASDVSVSITYSYGLLFKLHWRWIINPNNPNLQPDNYDTLILIFSFTMYQSCQLSLIYCKCHASKRSFCPEVFNVKCKLIW